MVLGLKIFLTSVGVYAGVRLAGIAIEWMKVGIDKLKPHKNPWDD